MVSSRVSDLVPVLFVGCERLRARIERDGFVRGLELQPHGINAARAQFQRVQRLGVGQLAMVRGCRGASLVQQSDDTLRVETNLRKYRPDFCRHGLAIGRKRIGPIKTILGILKTGAFQSHLRCNHLALRVVDLAGWVVVKCLPIRSDEGVI